MLENTEGVMKKENPEKLLVYLMLAVSLDFPFSLPLRYSLTCICPVSCVSYVASFSGLSFYIAPSVFSNMYLSCVLCTLCCQFLWIFLFHYPFGILYNVFVLCLVYPMLTISLDCPKRQSRETGNIGHRRHRTNKC
jgi:hypothetical protein